MFAFCGRVGGGSCGCPQASGGFCAGNGLGAPPPWTLTATLAAVVLDHVADVDLAAAGGPAWPAAAGCGAAGGTSAMRTLRLRNLPADGLPPSPRSQ